jgi:8-oxo-dGTP diphosphatase
MNREIPLHVVFVEAWIKKGDQYLIAQRSLQDDQAAGEWSAPGGKVDLEVEEDIIENSLKREVMEEVGIEIENELELISSKSFIRSSGDHVVGMSFLATYKSGEPQPLEDQEAIKWMSKVEMLEIMPEHFKKTILKLP